MSSKMREDTLQFIAYFALIHFYTYLRPLRRVVRCSLSARLKIDRTAGFYQQDSVRSTNAGKPGRRKPVRARAGVRRMFPFAPAPSPAAAPLNQKVLIDMSGIKRFECFILTGALPPVAGAGANPLLQLGVGSRDRPSRRQACRPHHRLPCPAGLIRTAENAAGRRRAGPSCWPASCARRIENQPAPAFGRHALERFRFSSNRRNTLIFVFTQLRTQNRFTLLLALLWRPTGL